MAKTAGRGRLSSIDLLPNECDAVVAWAAEQLMRREETQLALYAQFREKLIAIQGETGAAFDVPSFSSFNRFAIGKAVMGRRLEQTREIAKALSERMDHETSDELTSIAAETIKTLIFELLQAKGEAGITPKGAMELANALRAATAAQQLSTTRRQKVDKEFADKVDEAIDVVAKETGLTADAASKIRRDILGVRA